MNTSYTRSLLRRFMDFDIRHTQRCFDYAGKTAANGSGYHCIADCAEAYRKAAHQIRGIPEIWCLCGSTRFMDTFHSVGWQLTLEGCIVLSVGVCKHADHHGAEAIGSDVADRLDELHKRKIDLADHVMILNVNGYIGDSTRGEWQYALEQSKQVHWLVQHKCEMCGHEFPIVRHKLVYKNRLLRVPGTSLNMEYVSEMNREYARCTRCLRLESQVSAEARDQSETPLPFKDEEGMSRHD